VTFVASTGDYGAADPEFPAFSPNVVAVGGSSLQLNADNSYQSETGWGYYSDSQGTFIASGGGLSQYQPEPAYQQNVQSTGSRTTPDVSLVADPATGAWIADTYNLPDSNPFEVVGGTSLSAPAWSGLLALVNQARSAAGKPTLNSSSPTEAQQALYSLPQSDYNIISSGTNGYTANPGYNLVTGLGTPVANLLVSDLAAYHGTGTSYPGPTVGPLQDATLTATGANSGGPINVFSVFNSFTVTGHGPGFARDPGLGGAIVVGSPRYVTPAPGATGLTLTTHDLDIPTASAAGAPLTSANSIGALASSSAPNGYVALKPGAVSSPVGLTPRSWTGAAGAPAGQSGALWNAPASSQISTSPLPQAGAAPQQSPGSAAQSAVPSQTGWGHDVAISQIGRETNHRPILAGPRTGVVLDSALDEVAFDTVLLRGQEDGGNIGDLARAVAGVTDTAVLVDPRPQDDLSGVSEGSSVRLTDLMVAVGFCGFGSGLWIARKSKARSSFPRKGFFKFKPRAR
jgi:hypothetical protein